LGASINNAVGFPWEISRTTSLTKYGVLDIFTKDGSIQGYGSLFVLLPSYGIGFIVLTASQEGAWPPYVLSEALLTAAVPAVEEAAKEEMAQAKYLGRFLDPGGNGSWAELEMDDGPGLVLSALWSRGVKFAENMRLFPTEIVRRVEGGEEEEWAIVPDRTPIEPTLGSNLVLFSGCPSMAPLDLARYAGESMEIIIITKRAGQAVEIQHPALRLLLEKE
jgi:hypothetical protein